MSRNKTTPSAADPVRLLAAGSLRAALTEIAAASGLEVAMEFGPSGLLRARIEAGEAADLFASANLEHPQRLADRRGGEVRLFARNRLCALVQPGLEIPEADFLEALLREDLRIGISTPVADPSGDYAFALFDRAEARLPGAAEALKRKALQLVGGPDSPAPETPRSVYGWAMEEGRADLFLTYRTNAAQAAREVPGLRILQIPPDLDVGADYGLLVLSERPEAAALAEFILAPEGRAILEAHGFGLPPQSPKPE